MTIVAPMPRRLAPLDAAFLSIERRETPMHVGALQIYSLPGDAPSAFIRTLVQRFRAPEAIASPWNLRLADVPLSRLAPAVVITDELDYDYHVRHSALPQPGGERELGELVSHLHGVILDRSRPLWTCHVIEGLHGGRFAIYLKVHHALTDGIRCLNLLVDSLSARPDGQICAPWERRPKPLPKTDSAAPPERPEKPLSIPEWAAALTKAIRPQHGSEASDSVKPFAAPRSLLNGSVTNARRVATQQLDLGRVKQLAKRAGVSVNDIFLAVCSAALRRHLQWQSALPERSLTVAIPMSLRKPGDSTSANAVVLSWATLASDIDDPRQRLLAIRASTLAAKKELNAIPERARPLVKTLSALPATLVGTLGLSAWLPPPMNLVISNVPGPPSILHLGVARLEALYPISIPAQGMALNITCVSYAGQLNIGFTGCRDSLPHLQRLAVYVLDALAELEAAWP